MKSTMTSHHVKAHDLTFQLYISEEQIHQRTQEIGAALANKFKGRNPVFISILNGGFIFTADLTRACNIDCEISFIKVSSYDGLGSTGKITELIGLDTDVKDRDVIVVEDIVDTGETLSHFLKTLRGQNPRSVTLASLLVKPEALKGRFPVDYVGFNIPNKFVIGYGLDYNGAGRHLKGIYQLVEEDKG